MKHILKGLLFLICFFSSIGLSAAYVTDSTELSYQAKLYFDTSDLEIADSVIYIHLENNWIATNAIRTDEQGFYIFESDINDSGSARGIERRWKCPYCNYWWLMGQKCENPDCPTNQW